MAKAVSRVSGDRKRGWGIPLALLLLMAGLQHAEACRGTSSTMSRSFPLRVSENHRYLENAAGDPFFLQGDTAWSLTAQLSREDAERYLLDRKARGFNAILVNLLEARFASQAPANHYGDQPFRKAGDFSTPDEAYFSHAEWLIRKACELDMLVILTPSYAGVGGGEEGWYGAMELSGAEKLRDYGRYLGTRYRRLDNILWLAGGDFNPPDRSLVRAVVEGIEETNPGALHTAHSQPGDSATDYWSGETWLSLDTVYTYGPVHRAALAAYEREPKLPFFLIESNYENEHGADEHRVRIQAYQALLAGAAGQVFGNNPIWHFDGPGLFPVTASWQQSLDSRGARSMTIFHKLVSSIPWWRLQPDVDGTLLIAGRGPDDSRATAALSKDASLALVYLPTSRTVTVDLRKLAGSAITARWLDPSTGDFSAAKGSPFAPAVLKLKPPADNQAGFPDWVLELTSSPPTGSTR